jgi:protein TonB
MEENQRMARGVFAAGRQADERHYRLLAGALACSFTLHALAALYLPGWSRQAGSRHEDASALELVGLQTEDAPPARGVPLTISRTLAPAEKVNVRPLPDRQRPEHARVVSRQPTPPLVMVRETPPAAMATPAMAVTVSPIVVNPAPATPPIANTGNRVLDTAAAAATPPAPSADANAAAQAAPTATAQTSASTLTASVEPAGAAGTRERRSAANNEGHGGHAEVAYLYNPQPDYPSAARRLHLEGNVMLRVLVDESGRPGEMRVQSSSGIAALDAAALAKVRTWRFTPAKDDGATIAHWVDIPIRFHLED